MSRRKHPDIETLMTNPAYKKILELDFGNMIPFVMEHIRKKGTPAFVFAGINGAMLMGIPVVIVLGFTGNSLNMTRLLLQALSGIISGSLLIIPVHELIHGLAYRILGAKKIRFGVDLQQLIFFITADRHPVSGMQLGFIALTPFVVINLTTFFIVLFLFPGLLLFSCFFLLTHNIMCIGDFAMINYISRHNRRVYSFDEPEKKISYFYEVV
jgi:hypothetical protein